MTDSSDYRLYLDSRFEAMQTAQHAYFHEVHDKLDNIETQTTKTNSRVTKIEEDLIEYRMIKKYPKIAILIITVTVLGTIYGFMKIINTQVSTAVGASTDTLRNEIRHIEGISKETRGGIVKYRDVNGFADSVKVR